MHLPTQTPSQREATLECGGHVFPVLSSHDTESEHAIKKKKKIETLNQC